MALNQGTTTIRLEADLTSLKKDLTAAEKLSVSTGQRISDKFSTMSRKLSSIGSSMTKAITLPILGLGALAVKELAEVEKVNAQTQAALESTGKAAGLTAKDITNLASRMQRLAAVDAEEVQAAENVLLTFTNIRNEVGKGNKVFDKATLAILDMSARLGTDLQSATIQVGKALNDPIKGITALSRVGVSFTEQQKDQIEKLVENNKTMEAQKIILGELTTEFGGSAEAAGKTFSGQLNKLKFAFEDAGAVLLKKLMPHLKDFFEWITGLARKFSRLSPETQKWILIVAGIVAIAGPVIKAIGAIGAAISFFAAHPVVAGIAAAALLAVLIVKNWEKIKKVTLAVWNWIVDKIKWAWEHIFKYTPIGAFVSLIVRNFDKIKRVAGAVWTWMADKVDWVIDRIKTAIEWIGKAINAVKTLIGRTTSFGSSDEFRRLVEDAAGGGVGAGPLGNNLVGIGRTLQSQGFRVAGHPAFPPVGTHGEGSMHYVGRAIDVNWGAPGESAEEKVVLNSLAAKMRSTVGGIVELLYPGNASDHQDHLHLAMDQGGIVRGPAVIHQGAITEAHIPLSGTGARKWMGDTYNFNITADSTTDARKLARAIRIEFDKFSHEGARAARWQTRVAT